YSDDAVYAGIGRRAGAISALGQKLTLRALCVGAICRPSRYFLRNWSRLRILAPVSGAGSFSIVAMSASLSRGSPARVAGSGLGGAGSADPADVREDCVAGPSLSPRGLRGVRDFFGMVRGLSALASPN